MNAKRIAICLLALGAMLLPATAASAAEPAPAWRLDAFPMPANFTPGASGDTIDGPMYMLVATNVGGAQTSGPITITDTLPAGLAPVAAFARSKDTATSPFSCTLLAQTFSCTSPGPVRPGYALEAKIVFDVEPSAPASVLNEASVEGGGALRATATSPTPITTSAADFDFLAGAAGLSAPLFEADGAPATQAGSHPYGVSVNLGFPTKPSEGHPILGAGHLREATAELPRGEIANPAATPVLCTEAELISATCPDPAQVGTATVLTVGGGSPEANTTSLYNMVPPPGKASDFGFEALGVGVYAHVFGSVRSDGDYGLSGGSSDIVALPSHPIFGVRIDLWGDPSSPSHDSVRGNCWHLEEESCPVDPQSTALLTLPTECLGKPSITRAKADSWEEPDNVKETSYESADLNGNPVSIDGCNQLEFKPSFEAKPTTNVADSPSGLEFNLHQPQSMDLGGLSAAAMRDAVVTLPQGMVVNPSQADGLEACSPAQIGMRGAVGQSPVRLSKDPAACPDAAKLGTLQVKTPLLAQIDAESHKILRDEEGNAIPRTLEGKVYLAEPFQNPFNSLLAIYLVIEDERSGTIAKLAGRVEPDPATGQLKTVFTENPQLPLEDVALHLFGGARGSLITPIDCATHTTTSTLTPWSSPEGADAHPSDSFQITNAPGGGSCPGSEAQAPNGPAFTAGTVAPQAGAYSPFVLKLSRNDGSQRLAKIDATLPKGLAAKFAGVAQCSNAQIAQAQARSHPNQGILERQSPSCPASSQVGTVNVAAGAGPTPFNTTGTAYLAGPYKGAPLSMVIITPAIAGPFDLGAVVVRTALYVDPETAQGKAVSDPLPTILDGIPLDVRSIAVKLDRPDFTLNPTSCDPMSVTGSATSTLGGAAALTNHFQVGGCAQLPFKPKLSLKLKGGSKRASHPKLIATLKAKPGEANIAAAQVKLPPSAFLDQAHIRTICTRVQFAADTCPKGSIYGEASAKTPLLDEPLSGNVYLRSSNHKLPDLVVALKGPASMPIEIDLDGKTDSVKGALRNTFEAVPDAPVSSFRLELFGGKRGLVVNSRDLCKHDYKAEVNLTGQNGKVFDTEPVVGSDCGKGKRGRHGHRRHGGRS